MTTADEPQCTGGQPGIHWLFGHNADCGVPEPEPECNGICLYGADLGIPEYSGVAYAHPDCPEHGDPLEEHDEAEVCDAWGLENLRYVREEDMEYGSA